MWGQRLGLMQSTGLSERHLQMSEDGQHLNDDSIHSERVLTQAIQEEVIPYVEALFGKLDYNVIWKKKWSLYECQVMFEKYGGPPPDPDNARFCMNPDGGIVCLQKKTHFNLSPY